MRTLALYAILASTCACAAAQQAAPINIVVEAPSSAELGSAVAVRIALVNVSNGLVFLPRTYREDGMPAQLRVTLGTGACSKVLVDFRRGKPSSPEHLVPLYPAERLVIALPPLNVNVLSQNIWSDEGAATIRVDYATDRDDSRMAGVVSSPDTSIEFRRPDTEVIAARRAALAACVVTESDCIGDVAFFAGVKDAKGADLLVDLLRKRPYLFHVARAVASQGRARDADALETIAESGSADSDFIKRQTGEIRRRVASGCGAQDTRQRP